MPAIRPCAAVRGGFEGLARIIIGQQVSVASANAIWTRFAAVARPMTADVRQWH